MPRLLQVIALVLLTSQAAWGHFQELIPASDILDQRGARQVDLQLRFTHPMAGGPVMPMGKPAQFGVIAPDGRHSLLEQLQVARQGESITYRSSYRIKRPGDHLFYLEPAPYWEPGEGKMITHYTKVVVSAFGAEGGWYQTVGFPVEIEPLVRPYGLWSGNLFRGIVLHQGRPVPFAEVEVEWRNDGSLTPPADPYLTQVIRADQQGVFSYAMPRAGWWGFAALLESEEPVTNPAGRSVPAELGGLIWVYTREMR